MGLKIFGISWLTIAIAAVVAWFVYTRFVKKA